VASFTEAEAQGGTVSRTYSARLTGHTQGVAAGGTVGRDHAARLFGHPQGDGLTESMNRHYGPRLRDFPSDEASRQLISGIPIPSGAFRLVTVDVENPDGGPLEDAVWVQSAGIFPTSGRVKDGTAKLWLLDGVKYNSFLCLGENPEPNAKYDYVWYEAAGSNDVDPFTKETTLVFDPQKETSPLVAGGGVFFG